MERENTNIKLTFIHDDLQRQLTLANTCKENHDLYFQNLCQDFKQTSQSKFQKTFFSLNANSEQLSNLYDIDQTSKNHSFFYQFRTDEVSQEEDTFTSALTQYTRKQFFDGIGDLAGGSDNDRYDLLDINKPETLLIRGEREEINQQDRKELERLKSQFVVSENERIMAELQCVQLKRSVALAEKQLQQLSSGTLMLSKNKFKDDIKKLEDEIVECKQQLQECHQTKLQPLLQNLQELHSARVLLGNYDLKLARQNYFLAKQDKVVEHLLDQCSRNYFRSMLYELDLREHRNSYHLMLSAKSLIEKEVEAIQKRISYLSDPILMKSNANKKTISSKDELINKLYDSIVKTKHNQESLYKTYESLRQETQVKAFSKKKVKADMVQVEESIDNYLELFHTTLDATEKLLTSQYFQSNEELSALISSLEDNLFIVEHQVNDVIKDIVRKRKNISSDPFKVMERSIYVNFFNDPNRLKSMMAELETRVQVFAASS